MAGRIRGTVCSPLQKTLEVKCRVGGAVGAAGCGCCVAPTAWAAALKWVGCFSVKLELSMLGCLDFRSEVGAEIPPFGWLVIDSWAPICPNSAENTRNVCACSDLRVNPDAHLAASRHRQLSPGCRHSFHARRTRSLASPASPASPISRDFMNAGDRESLFPAGVC